MGKSMQGQIVNTENGVAILVPEEVLAASKFKVGDAVNIHVRGGRLVVNDPSEPYYTAEELVAGITDENIHTVIEWGPPVGKEPW